MVTAKGICMFFVQCCLAAACRDYEQLLFCTNLMKAERDKEREGGTEREREGGRERREREKEGE